MAVIQDGGVGGAFLGVDSTSKAAKTTLYTPNGDSCMDETNDALKVVMAASGTGTQQVVGAAAHDAAVSGNPVLEGLEARTTDGTPVTAGDVVRSLADTLGKQVGLIGSLHELRISGTTNFTTNAAADVIAAQAAGIKLVVVGILVTNAHAAQGTKVSIRDGTTVKAVGYATFDGGGFYLTAGGSPLFVGTAATAITAICGTTGVDVDVTVFAYKITN